MTDQPEPLRLADALSGVMYSADDVVKAAAELRRLHGEVERLRAALEAMLVEKPIDEILEYAEAAKKQARNALKEPK